MRIAVILTCHNRRVTTLDCLRALEESRLPSRVSIKVFLVDDGSTDGTGDAVRDVHPEVDVINGDGNLFWNGGMRVAFGAALVGDFDAYLWLNDDTKLFPDAIEKLLAVASADDQELADAIVVGATRDPVTGLLTYGGLVSRDPRSPHYYVHLPVSESVQQCHSINGNCVLIPRSVAAALGNLDPAFVHAIGDWDYGLRARKAGFPILMAPGFVGECRDNPVAKIPAHQAANMGYQLRRVCGPKGVPPRAWFVYVRRHYGPWWIGQFLRPYIGAVLRAMKAKYCQLLGGEKP